MRRSRLMPPNEADAAIILKGVYDFWRKGEEVFQAMYPTKLAGSLEPPLVDFPTPHHVHEFLNSMQRPEKGSQAWSRPKVPKGTKKPEKQTKVRGEERSERGHRAKQGCVGKAL